MWTSAGGESLRSSCACWSECGSHLCIWRNLSTMFVQNHKHNKSCQLPCELAIDCIHLWGFLILELEAANINTAMMWSMPCPWRCSRPGWMRPWATWSSKWGSWWPCLAVGLEIHDPWGPFQPRPFCDSVRNNNIPHFSYSLWSHIRKLQVWISCHTLQLDLKVY